MDGVGCPHGEGWRMCRRMHPDAAQRAAIQLTAQRILFGSGSPCCVDWTHDGRPAKCVRTGTHGTRIAGLARLPSSARAWPTTHLGADAARGLGQHAGERRRVALASAVTA